VGLLDADIYGPSIPGMMGIQAEPKVVDQKLVPLEAFGVRLMSIGFLSGADKAMVWRGPMVSRAIEQMLTDVHWGELDYLVIDLPPGTGDASLTLAQAVPLTGVAIVCTPQAAALGIAVKALQMFRGLNVTPLGLVENMSSFVCGRCSEEHFIFDHGGAERAAKRLGVPYLGGIPLEKVIREEADAGAPVVVSRPDTAGAKAFRNVASAVAARVSVQSFRQLPVINVS
jgi:ATP-binding protein involved in chromosome partitioning